MIFAEISDAVWLAAIGLLTVLSTAAINIITMVIKEYFDRERYRISQAEAKEVKTTLEQTNAKQREQHQTVVAGVEEIKKATNGMKHELVEEVRKASFARGEKSEKDRQGGPSAPVSPATAGQPAASPPEGLHQAIEQIPEKTAEKVVEKLKEDKTSVEGV